MIRLLVVDDHDFIRSQIIAIFRTIDDIEVVGECSAGDQVVGTASRVRPDVVLMDVQLGATSGMAATRALLAVDPTVRVLMLTGSRSRTAQEESNTAGASGFLLKGGDPRDLVAAVRTIGNGGTRWPPNPAPADREGANQGNDPRVHTAKTPDRSVPSEHPR